MSQVMRGLPAVLKRSVALAAVVLGLLPFNALAAQCYIGKNCFGVTSPCAGRAGLFSLLSRGQGVPAG